MKKILKVLSLILLITSILIIAVIVVFNLVTIIRIMFFGITIDDVEYPNSIWWGKTILHGISGIKTYYSVWGEVVLLFEIPICIVCLIYQIIYFKIIRKKL